MTIPSVSNVEVLTISNLLETLRTHAGLSFEYEISCPDQDALPAGQNPSVRVNLHGADSAVLTARNAELLYAIEQVAAAILRLEPESNDRIDFDVNGSRAARKKELQIAAEQAVRAVRSTGRPYAFPPMNSRERRLLHLTLAGSGLPTSSSGEHPRRWVVLYPDKSTNVGPSPAPHIKPVQAPPKTDLRAAKIRDRFRPRS